MCGPKSVTVPVGSAGDFFTAWGWAWRKRLVTRLWGGGLAEQVRRKGWVRRFWSQWAWCQHLLCGPGRGRFGEARRDGRCWTLRGWRWHVRVQRGGGCEGRGMVKIKQVVTAV